MSKKSDALYLQGVVSTLSIHQDKIRELEEALELYRKKDEEWYNALNIKINSNEDFNLTKAKEYMVSREKLQDFYLDEVKKSVKTLRRIVVAVAWLTPLVCSIVVKSVS